MRKEVAADPRALSMRWIAPKRIADWRWPAAKHEKTAPKLAGWMPVNVPLTKLLHGHSAAPLRPDSASRALPPGG
jgi:hypothetical protein